MKLRPTSTHGYAVHITDVNGNNQARLIPFAESAEEAIDAIMGGMPELRQARLAADMPHYALFSLRDNKDTYLKYVEVYHLDEPFETFWAKHQKDVRKRKIVFWSVGIASIACVLALAYG